MKQKSLFRANHIPPTLNPSHIPSYFPLIRQPELPSSNPERKEIVDENSKDKWKQDQMELQKILQQLRKSRENEVVQSLTFDSELTQLVAKELISKPTHLLESHSLTVQGYKQISNPSNSPFPDVEFDLLIGGGTNKELSPNKSFKSDQKK